MGLPQIWAFAPMEPDVTAVPHKCMAEHLVWRCMQPRLQCRDSDRCQAQTIKEETMCSLHVLPPSQRQHTAHLLSSSCCCTGLAVSSSICCCQSRLAGMLVPLPTTIR